MLKSILKHFFLFFLMFSFTYFGIYYIFFNIQTTKGPLITKIQHELVISRDVFERSMNEFDLSKKYDLIFLGSSHCYRCFDPLLFEKHGMDTYNLGSTSQTPLNSYCLLKKYIHNTDKVILDVYPVTNNISGRESFLTFVSSCDDLPLITDMVFQLNDLRCYNLFSIYPFIRNYNRDKPYDTDHITKGYVETTDSIKKDDGYKKYTMEKDKYLIQLTYLEKIIKMCKSNDKEIILVYVPIPQELIINKEDEFISELEKIRTANNIEFYNYGRNHSLNSRNHFFDDDHLNKAGVEIFNNWVIERLKDVQ